MSQPHLQQVMSRGILRHGHTIALGSASKWRCFSNKALEGHYLFVGPQGQLRQGPTWAEAKVSSRSVREYYWALGAEEAPNTLEDLGL
jgi:hypothetical protein